MFAQRSTGSPSRCRRRSSSRSSRRLSASSCRADNDTSEIPRHTPATVHELARIGLLSGLPGEQLDVLAHRMEREEVAAGSYVVAQGEPGDRFYVVLSGMLTVSQEGLGERRVLKPGDYFGEVALAMSIPRTASVRALTLAVVASCDAETFDELLRPLFADE